MTGEELKENLKKQGIELTELANRLNISKQNLYSKLKIKDIGIGLVKEIALAVNKSIYDLINEPEDIGIRYVNDDTLQYNNKIPLIPIEAMAGFGNGDIQVMEYETEQFVIPTFKGADFLIGVKGSSMYPKYNSGDIVACKKLELSDIFFQWNKVYVLDTEQGALIKRVKKGKSDDYILIVSDNIKYDPFELHRNKIHAVALVIGVVRLE